MISKFYLNIIIFKSPIYNCRVLSPSQARSSITDARQEVDAVYYSSINDEYAVRLPGQAERLLMFLNIILYKIDHFI